MFTSKPGFNEGKAAAVPAAAAHSPLTVGDENSPLEAEADALANKVTQAADPQTAQRKCAACAAEEDVQRKPLPSFIQKKEAEGGAPAGDAVSEQINSSRGSGEKMTSSTLGFMENRFGADFSGVRIHQGNDAAQLSDTLNAQAFTVGSDIYFNSGKYAPETSEGKHLLAHELTHVLQQGNGALLQRAPVKDPGTSKSAAGQFDPLVGIYTVAPGDTLNSIATRFGTTAATIQKNNPDIKNINKISVGQKIFLPDLIIPHDPTGMKHKEISLDDYVKRWEAEKGRPITSSEKTELERGCVGISSVNTGKDPLDNLDNCFQTFEQSLKFARAKNEAIKAAGDSKKKKAVIFSMRFWSGGKPYAPDPSGKIDMTDYDSRLASGDAWRPDDAFGSDYINFDFGYYDVDSGMWWHANHAHDPGPLPHMGDMRAYESSLDYYSKPLLDFDKQIFCVAVKTL
jgi:LysM repeat protein